MDINEFYLSLLNIGCNGINIIRDIVSKERNEVKAISGDMSGFCKYMAAVLEEEFKKAGIVSYYIDLNNIGVDHVILIAEYKELGEIRRVLVDPTFIQFVKRDNLQLKYLQEWPSEVIKDEEMIKDLVEKGLTEIDNQKFLDYLYGFGYLGEIDLNRILLDIRMKENCNEINKMLKRG